MQTIVISMTTGDGKNSDVIDAAEHLAVSYGSASNAAVQMIRDSQLFRQALNEIAADKAAEQATA